jgi:hypothetical protein
MKRFGSKHFAAAALAAFGLGLAAVPAAGNDTTCTGPLSNGTINGNLVVPNGATCRLLNETVAGNVSVGNGAALDVNGATIAGNIRATHCNFVRLNNVAGAVSVAGNVTIEFCTGTVQSGYNIAFSQLLPTAISGNFSCSNNSAPCVATFGSVAGNVRVNDNTGGTSVVGGNTIGGNLSCRGNTGVSDNGFNNTVAGNKLGQCAGL